MGGKFNAPEKLQMHKKFCITSQSGTSLEDNIKIVVRYIVTEDVPFKYVTT
jgi:hypothetical protein